jgi:hypothetical protein
MRVVSSKGRPSPGTAKITSNWPLARAALPWKEVQKRTECNMGDIALTIQALPTGSDAIERLCAYAIFHASTDATIFKTINDLKASNDATKGQTPVAPKDLTHDI